MYIDAMFAFSFGGSDDFGKTYKIGEKFFLDFSPKPTGIGFAIRNGVDADFDLAKQIKVKMCADKEIKSTIEFKTVNSCGAPEKAKDIILSKGENKICIDIPNLRSRLTEIVILIPRNGGIDVTNFTISTVELI